MGPSQSAMHEQNVAELAGLQTRVKGVEDDVHDIKVGMSGLRKDFSDGLGMIQNKLEQRGATPWPVIISLLGLILTFCSVIGWLTIRPLQEDQHSMRAAFAEALRDAKQDRKEAAQQSIERDRQIWGFVNPLQRQADRLEGELRARRPTP